MRSLLRAILLACFANGFAIYLVTYFFPEKLEITSDSPVFAFAAIGFTIGFLNRSIKPILKIISFPFVILTMGAFLAVINGVIFWIIKWFFNDILTSFQILITCEEGFMNYIFIGLVLAIINGFLHWILKK